MFEFYPFVRLIFKYFEKKDTDLPVQKQCKNCYKFTDIYSITCNNCYNI